MTIRLHRLFLVAGLLAAVLVAGSTRVSAQARQSSKAHVVEADPLGLAVNMPFNVSYEYKDGPVNSWVIRGHYWGGLTGNGAGSWSGPGLGAAYRYYIADSRAITALSVAPKADLFFFNQSLPNGTGATAIVLWIGGEISYKWIFDQFCVEPSLGLHIGYTPATNSPTKPTGGVATIGLNAGYAW